MNSDQRPLQPKPLSRRVRIALIFGGLAALSILAVILFSSPLADALVKPQIVKEFRIAYPDMSLHIGRLHYSFLSDQWKFDSVRVNDSAGNAAARAGTLSVKGIGWIHLLWRSGFSTKDFHNTTAELTELNVRWIGAAYEYSAARLVMSVPDSLIAAEGIAVTPKVEDEKFFAESRYRRTRSIFSAASVSLHAVPILAVLTESLYTAGRVIIRDPFLDLLVNIDKPKKYVAVRPLMPDEVFSSIPGIFKIDTLSLTNGRVRYGERYALRAKPAVITIDDLNAAGNGFTNRGDTGTFVTFDAEGTLMRSGIMKLHMAVPVRSSDGSFRYSGSVEKLKLTDLNSFLETAEQVRIRSGSLQRATFEIDVRAGRADGSVRALYRDLKFVLIDKKSGSENGIFNVIASLIANTFKIRRSNPPDKGGVITDGVVHYVRAQDDSPFQFSWFALRSGIKDVVGF